MDFKKVLLFFLCLALLLLSGSGLALAESKVSAKILSIEGDVQVIRAGGEKSFAAFVNMRLTEGDRIITGTDGGAEIEMDDELIVILAENTRIYLSELRGSGDSQQTSVSLQSGSLGSSVNKKLDATSRYEIKTPTAVMGVRGTEFFTQYFRGNLDVRVVDGVVDLTVGLSEGGQVSAASGSAWSGSAAGGSFSPSQSTITFQLSPLRQISFGQGLPGAQLAGQIADFSLDGLPERFIDRIQEIAKGDPEKIPQSILGQADAAMQKALENQARQAAVAEANPAEYDQTNEQPRGAEVQTSLPPQAPTAPSPAESSGGGGSSGGSSSDPGPTDPELEASATIEIIAVESGLILDGHETQFTVRVAYTMTNIDEAEVNIGFNNGDNINTSKLIAEGKSLVQGPLGEHTFIVNAVSKNWEPDGDFKVYVNISTKDHEANWRPLAMDTRTLYVYTMQPAFFNVFYKNNEGQTVQNPGEITKYFNSAATPEDRLELYLESEIQGIGYDFEIFDPENSGNVNFISILPQPTNDGIGLDIIDFGEAILKISAHADDYQTYVRDLLINIVAVNMDPDPDYTLEILRQPEAATRTSGRDEFKVQPIIRVLDSDENPYSGDPDHFLENYSICAEKYETSEDWQLDWDMRASVEANGEASFNDLWLKASEDLSQLKIAFILLDEKYEPVEGVKMVISDPFAAQGIGENSTGIWSETYKVTLSSESVEAANNAIGNFFNQFNLKTTTTVSEMLGEICYLEAHDPLVQFKVVEVDVYEHIDLATLTLQEFQALTGKAENDKIGNNDILLVYVDTGKMRAYKLEPADV